jgi:heme/copper-type cytochrome/quinol oxidase subunit 2
MNPKLSKSLILLTSFLFFFSFFACCYAVDIPSPISSQTFTELLNKIIDFIFYVSLPVAAIMITVAGFYFVTAAGEPEKIQKAKIMILWTLIGLLVVFLAKGLVAALRGALGVQ